MGDLLKRPLHDESTYRMIYENSLEGILLTIPDSAVIAANPAACQLFGMSEIEICASNITMLFDISEILT